MKVRSNVVTNDQDEAIQTLFDDVDRTFQQMQTTIRIDTDLGWRHLRLEREILELQKAVQILRPTTSTLPTGSIQDQDLETLSESPKTLTPNFDYLSDEEIGLLNLIRSEGMSADKLTTFLSSGDPFPFRSRLLNNPRQ